MSNPDAPGPYWQESAGGDYGNADYGGTGYGSGRADYGPGRRAAPGGSYRDAPATGASGSGGSPRNRPPRGGEDPWDAQRGGAGRSRRGSGAGPAGDQGRDDSRYRSGGPAERAPRGSRGARGYRPDQGSGSGQVAQDLRDRLGVRGSPGGRGPRGGAPAGYADDGRTLQRDRPGTGRDPGWRSRGDGPVSPAGRGHRSGRGGHGGGGYGGGPGGPGGGRRTFTQWLRSGSWWRHWTLKKALAVVGAAGLGVVVLAFGAFFAAYEETPVPTDATAAALAQPSQVYYSDGSTIGTFSDQGMSREILTAQEIPPVMQNAIIAAEDRHFLTEGGISPTGVLRAAFEDLKGGCDCQGGSTLTEQFVKNYYSGFTGADNADKSGTDKLKQMMVAIKLAHLKSKSWILTQYLNTVPFGQNAYGVGAAAQTYFDENISKVTVSQAAMLAALVNAPGAFNPDPSAGADYTALKARWRYVLTNMVRDGALTAAKANAEKFPKVHYHFSSGWTGSRGYIMQMVEQELESTYGLSQAKLDNGGLKIYTTISKAMMTELAAAVGQNKQLMAEGGVPLPSYAHVGAVLEQPGTGAILAVYGGSGWNSNTKKCERSLCEYNMAEAPEPVGSSFKPYVLSTAVKQGMDVQDSILNGYSPIYIPPDWTQADRSELSSQTRPADDFGWTHFDEADENTGPLTVPNATAISSDPAYEDLTHRVGVQAVLNTARSLGIGQNPFNANGSNDMTGLEKLYGPHGTSAGSLQVALGAGPLTTVEQATTFATLAADGQYSSAHVVSKIEQGSGTLPSKVVHSAPLTAAQAADVDYALSFDNQSRYPGATAYPNAAWDRPVVAKTGTLGNGAFASEAWFNGAIPQYSLSVSLFTNKQSENIDGLGGISGGLGGTWPAKIWHTFMATEFSALPVVQLPTPNYAGQTQWNQVTGLQAVSPTPQPGSTSPAPGSTCSPAPGQQCIPGGSPPSDSPSPSPSSTCGALLGPCTSSSPPTPTQGPTQGPHGTTTTALFTLQPAEDVTWAALLRRAPAAFLAGAD